MSTVQSGFLFGVGFCVALFLCWLVWGLVAALSDQ